MYCGTPRLALPVAVLGLPSATSTYRLSKCQLLQLVCALCSPEASRSPGTHCSPFMRPHLGRPARPARPRSRTLRVLESAPSSMSAGGSPDVGPALSRLSLLLSEERERSRAEAPANFPQVQRTIRQRTAPARHESRPPCRSTLVCCPSPRCNNGWSGRFRTIRPLCCHMGEPTAPRCPSPVSTQRRGAHISTARRGVRSGYVESKALYQIWLMCALRTHLRRR